MTGIELMDLLSEQLPHKEGAVLMLVLQDKEICPKKTLREQGITEMSSLSYLYKSINLPRAQEPSAFIRPGFICFHPNSLANWAGLLQWFLVPPHTPTGVFGRHSKSRWEACKVLMGASHKDKGFWMMLACLHVCIS